MRGFRVVDVETGGDELGQAVLTDDGEWRTVGDVAAGMVRAMKVQGYSDEQVLSYYDGWSNGRINTVAIP